MNCNFRGCDCWGCFRNDPEFICRYYKEKCFKKLCPGEKVLISECSHLIAIKDNRNIIFKKTDQVRKTILKKSRDVKIWLYLQIGWFKDLKDYVKGDH